MRNLLALLPARSARAFATCAVAAVVAPLISCRSDSVDLEPVVRPVLVQPATRASDVFERRFPARAQAGTESALSFKVGGQVSEILVEVGERVTRGQKLAALDAKDLTLQLRRAEAGYAEASARDRNARSEYARAKLLYDEDAVSANRLESTQTEAVSARANLQAQAQAVALAKAQFGYAEMVAPADGLIASVDVNPNENVSAGEPVITLNAGGRPEVRFTAPENLIGSIERGQPATVRFTSIEDTIFPAEIVEVGVGSGRSAFPVTARLLEPDDRVRSGMVAEISVRFERAEPRGEPAVIVPAFSVAEDGGGRFVYVAIPENDEEDGDLATIERRAVEIGELSVEGLEIEEGLTVGDRVVIAGLRFVESGMTVRMMAP